MGDQDRPAFHRAKALIEALNEDGRPMVVNGLLQAVLIAEANAKDAAVESKRNEINTGCRK